MPIQFQCPHCRHALQLPDSAAGKQGKCPKCGGVVTVPSGAAPALSPEDEEFWSEVGGEPQGPHQPEEEAPAGPEKKSDAQVLKMYFEDKTEEKELRRTGFPWEISDEGFFDRYWDTAVAIMNHPSDTWATMKLGGGYGKPLTYLLTGAAFGCFFGAVWVVAINLVVLFTTIQGMQLEEGQVRPPMFTTAIVVGLAVVFFGGFLGGAVAVVIGNFIQAALVHLMAKVVGIKDTNYETTFRVVSYANGSIMVWSVIPLFGGLFGLIVWLYSVTFGLASSYNVPNQKAALAVILYFVPFVLPQLVIVALFAKSAITGG